MTNKGLVIAYTGEGKGKTTAALGVAFRASGYGKKTSIIQFIKNQGETGEIKASKNSKNINIRSMGLGFVGIGKDNRSIEEHRVAASRTLELASSEIQSDYEIVILDEIFVALDLGLIAQVDVLELINQRRPDQTIILTGREAPQGILEKCDLITEMKCIKHPFDRKIAAIESIDF